MVFTDLTYTAFLVPTVVAFGHFWEGSLTWLEVLNAVGNMLYLLDLVLGFHIGFIVKDRTSQRGVVLTGARAPAACAAALAGGARKAG